MNERLTPPEEFVEEPEPEPIPEASAGSAGMGPPTTVGGGLRGEGGDFWDEPPIGFPRRRDLPLEDLNLSMRAYNCLRRSGLSTVNDVRAKSEEQLLALQNSSRKCYDELRESLDELRILPIDAPWTVE